MENELIKRKCVLTLQGGHKVEVELLLRKTDRPFFPETLERRLVKEFNDSQPCMVNKVVSIHILRN